MKDFHHFIEGFSRFRELYFEADNALFDSLRHGQHPKAVVIGCSDSRVDPAMLLHCDPGDIFVTRNVANLVPAYGEISPRDATAAAVEYGIRHLKAEHLIVLGHSDCGGIHALLDFGRIAGDEHLPGWVGMAAPALRRLDPEVRDESMEIRRRHCEEAAVLQSAENLLSWPWIRELVAAHRLSLHAWYFDMHIPALLAYMPDREDFVPVTP